MNWDIVTAATLNSLRDKVNESPGEVMGAPFRDEARNLWCQAIIRRPQKPGEVRLAEPKRK